MTMHPRDGRPCYSRLVIAFTPSASASRCPARSTASPLPPCPPPLIPVSTSLPDDPPASGRFPGRPWLLWTTGYGTSLSPSLGADTQRHCPTTGAIHSVVWPAGRLRRLCPPRPYMPSVGGAATLPPRREPRAAARKSAIDDSRFADNGIEHGRIYRAGPFRVSRSSSSNNNTPRAGAANGARSGRRKEVHE